MSANFKRDKCEFGKRAAKPKFVAQSWPAVYNSQQQVDHTRLTTLNISQVESFCMEYIIVAFKMLFVGGLEIFPNLGTEKLPRLFIFIYRSSQNICFLFLKALSIMKVFIFTIHNSSPLHFMSTFSPINPFSQACTK